MAIQKKHGKGRLDKWYKLAKEKGYRARAAFKLIQLNKKYGFLEKSKVVLDLCAAPGSWMQVCAETLPTNSLIIGVDLSPIKPIPKCIAFQGDIRTDQCRSTIRGHLKTWKADCVLHDGAPNVGTAWVQDSYNQAELVLHSLKLATEFLVEGGSFVTKVFRSKDYNPLLWVFKQLFAKVEATKPPSSRNVSAEIFVVCRGFLAPKRIDPRLLDFRFVFEDLKEAPPNVEAKVYNPEVKRRKRGGYDEGDYLQFKEVAASEFIRTTDPIAILGSINKLSFSAVDGDVAQAALDKLPETTPEIRDCCADLKVLGKKDFRRLLKWRLRVREIFGLATTKTAEAGEEVAEVQPMDEELQMQEELQKLGEKESARKKRERRRLNEKKQKDIARLRFVSMDIGLEQDGLHGPDSVFRLQAIDKTDAMGRISKGKMVVPVEPKKDEDVGSEDDDEDDEGDGLEHELDALYEQYTERKAAADAKYRAKRARMEHDDEEWEGVSAGEPEDSDNDLEEEGSEEEGEEEVSRSLVRDLDGPASGGLSKRARRFFDQDIFKDMAGILDTVDAEAEDHVGGAEDAVMADEDTVMTEEDDVTGADQDASDDDIPAVSHQSTAEADEDDWEEVDRREREKEKDGMTNIEMATAEAMTLAHQLATGEKTSHGVVDDGFNRYAFKDRDGLPDWFLDDEAKHDKPHRPITKAAAAAIQEKLRAYNARPIKKVREAKARRQFKAAQRLEKMRKKGEMLMAEDGLTEREKADRISSMVAKYRAAKKGPRRPITVVKANGVNKGKGRPRGVKGRYRMVDPRMKKELRANKRVAKKKKA